MDVDRERNFYSCEGFVHLARNYRNQSLVDQERRIECRDNLNTSNNLKEKESLIVLN